MNDELVDHVQNRGNYEHLSHILPPLLQQLAATRRVAKNCPEEGWAVLTRVPQAGPDCEDRRNGRLEDQAEIHWSCQATNEVLPYPCQDLAHEPIPAPSQLAPRHDH